MANRVEYFCERPDDLRLLWSFLPATDKEPVEWIPLDQWMEWRPSAEHGGVGVVLDEIDWRFQQQLRGLESWLIHESRAHMLVLVRDDDHRLDAVEDTNKRVKLHRHSDRFHQDLVYWLKYACFPHRGEEPLECHHVKDFAYSA